MLRNNKGFTLIEILVTVGLVAVLSTIAVPAYKSYRVNTFKVVLKSDAGSGYKMYHAYNAANGDYCASLQEAGLVGIISSDNYKKKPSFVGFDSTDCTNTPVKTGHTINHKGAATGNSVAAVTSTECKLSEGSFAFGVASPFSGGLLVGYSVTDQSSAPIEHASSSCSDDAYSTKADCKANSETWTQGTSITDLCKR